MHVHGSAERARSSSHAVALGGAHRAQRRRRRARRRGRRVHAERPLPGRRRAARRQPHDDRPREAALRQPRALQGHPRRPGARRLQRQDHRPAGRAEDRREADQQDAAALRRRADQHEAAARDLRRRREVHARRDGRPARRGRAVLPAGARHRRSTRRASLLIHAFAGDVLDRDQDRRRCASELETRLLARSSRGDDWRRLA